MNNKDEFDFDTFKKRFQVKRTGGDGNCLFNAIEILTGKSNEDSRKFVCEFYKNHEPSVLNEQAEFQYMFDNIDKDEKGVEIKHSDNICNNLVYASILDAWILTQLVKRNIVLIISSAPETGKKKSYRTNLLEYHTLFKKPKTRSSEPELYIHFNGVNHYEALLVRDGTSNSNSKTNSKTNSNSKTKSKSKSKSKSNNKTQKKSPFETDDSFRDAILYRRAAKKILKQMQEENRGPTDDEGIKLMQAEAVSPLLAQYSPERKGAKMKKIGIGKSK